MVGRYRTAARKSVRITGGKCMGQRDAHLTCRYTVQGREPLIFYLVAEEVRNGDRR
jgi:hypothetical protein